MATSIGTWSFSLPATNSCVSHLLQGRSVVDAVVESVQVASLESTAPQFSVFAAAIEDDVETGVYQVGRGGFPDSAGIVTLDAAVMSGDGGRFGGVAALEGIATPIAVARRVLEASPHSLLVGPGAQRFARDHGFTVEPNEQLLPPGWGGEGPAVRREGSGDLRGATPSHDTLSVIALDKNRNIAAGVSTSGAKDKHPGRVGDSPLPGSGLFADNAAGAACCTGDGDVLLRFCPAALAVEMLRQGTAPLRAAAETVQRVARTLGAAPGELEMGIIVLDTQGVFGASGTVRNAYDLRTKESYSGFPYSVSTEVDGQVEGQIHVARSLV